MAKLTDYIGRPYEECNCFELVKDFYLNEFGLNLRNYFEGESIPDRKTVESLIISNKGDFVQVSKPEFGTLVVIRLFGYSCHIGVAIDSEHILHTTRNTGSCIELLHRYEKMIEGYYLHRERP